MGEFAKALSDIAAGYAAIATAFENLSKAVKQDMKAQAEETTPAPESESRFVKSDKPAPPFEEVVKTAEDISQPMKLEIVRACLANLSQAGHTKEVKELLKKYGANKLSAIKQEDYVALMKDAEAIANNAA